jgi:uncharacterized protein RhaS with RHS repeats
VRTSVVNRYYDPATGLFVSVDPMIDETGLAYQYGDDNPVNAVDPDGLDCGWFSYVCAGYDATTGGIKNAAKFVTHHWLQTVEIGGALISVVVTDGATSEVLVETLTVAAEDDATTVVVEQTVVTVTEDSAIEQVFGTASKAAAAAATASACYKSQTSSDCAIDLVTLGIPLAVARSGVSAITSALTDFVASLPSARHYFEPSDKKLC